MTESFHIEQYLFNKEGKNIDLKTWSELAANHEYRQVARTEDVKNYTVSTVWVGLDLPLTGRMFESAVFKVTPGEWDGNKWIKFETYKTEEEARAGHKNLVTSIENGTFKEDDARDY